MICKFYYLQMPANCFFFLPANNVCAIIRRFSFILTYSLKIFILSVSVSLRCKQFHENKWCKGLGMSINRKIMQSQFQNWKYWTGGHLPPRLSSTAGLISQNFTGMWPCSVVLHRSRPAKRAQALPRPAPPPLPTSYYPALPTLLFVGGALIYRALQFLLEALARTCEQHVLLFFSFCYYVIIFFSASTVIASQSSDNFTNLTASYKIWDKRY